LNEELKESKIKIPYQIKNRKAHLIHYNKLKKLIRVGVIMGG